MNNNKHTIRFSNIFMNLLTNGWSNIILTSIIISCFVVAIVLLLSLKRRRLLQTRHERFGQKDHQWSFTDLFKQPTYCNVCESGMVSGVRCNLCNIYSHTKCLKRAKNQFKCKELFITKQTPTATNEIYHTNPNESSTSTEIESNQQQTENSINNEFHWPHHWVKGNLKLNSACCVCHETDCGATPDLSDWKCVWCWRTIHDSCLKSTLSTPNDYLTRQCDFGEFRNLILKPNLVLPICCEEENLKIQQQQKDNLNYSHKHHHAFYINSILDIKFINELMSEPSTIYNQDYSANDWTPLIVFANSKSGSNDAIKVMANLSSVLNPLQIIDMNTMKPNNVLKWMATHSDYIKFKILICGGDGSIGWILDCLNQISFKVLLLNYY
jgi:diacylglycerol kinase (ATP)